jgi:signal transduction histidine kinase
MLQRVAGGRKGRWIWATIVALAALLLAGTFQGAGRAAERARAAAVERARRYAETVLFEHLDPSLPEEQILGPLYRRGTILGPRYRALLIAVQDSILIDPLVVRVRVWDSEGVLIFSTDTADRIGTSETVDRAALTAALGGRTTSTTLEVGAERVLRTVTPLRVPGQLVPTAVAGIDEDAAQISADATAPWTRARFGALAVLVVALGLLAVAIIHPEPAVRAARERRGAGAEAVEGADLRAEVEGLRAEVEGLRAEREGLRLDLERAADELGAARSEVASLRARLASQSEVPSEVGELRAALAVAREELGRTAEGAARTEGELALARESARVAEERVRELERVLSVKGFEIPGHGGDLPSEAELRDYELTLRTAAVRQLRGPLSRLRGVAHSLKQEASTSEARDLSARLFSIADRLDVLVGDLESLSDLVDGSLPLQLRRTELERFIGRVVSEYGRDTGRTVLLDAQPALVAVDQARLRQVLEVLLDDAGSRTGEHQALKVKVRPHEEGAVVSVEEPNPSVPSPAARHDVQLAVVRRLVELHGGRIWREGRRDGTSAVLVLFRTVGRSERSSEGGGPAR